MQPTPAELELLLAIANGFALKSHRDLEGNKEYRLHSLAGQSVLVVWEDVEALHSTGLIDSNKKFRLIGNCRSNPQMWGSRTR